MLKVGDVFKLESGDKVYASLPAMFMYDNGNYDMRPARGELKIGVVHRGLNTDIFIGEYVVTRTETDGGGEGFPDGHHVWASKIYEDFDGSLAITDFCVDFYQSGCFTCTLPNKTAVRSATLKWVLQS